MDECKWSVADPKAEAPAEGGDWRATLKAESRQRVVNKIMETLKRHLPVSGFEGQRELKKIAVRFEEKSYTGATSQSDYLRNISLKMLSMESKSQKSIPNSLWPSIAAWPTLQPQVHNQGQSLPIPLPVNQVQGRQQLLSQNMQNNMTSSTRAQTSASLSSSFPPVSGTNQTPINVVGQNADSTSNVAQNPVGSTSMAQGVPSNIFGDVQQQQLLIQFQQQLIQLQGQLVQLQGQLVQLQQQLLMQSQLQQLVQPQQSAMPIEMTQLQPATQSGMQTSSVSMMWAPISSLPQNQLYTSQQSIAAQLQLQQQQLQRLLSQQTQQSNLYGMHHQQLGLQSNFSGLQQPSQQQNFLATQTGNSSMQNNLSEKQSLDASGGESTRAVD